MSSVILAGDIGATKTVLALYRSDAERTGSVHDSVVAEKTFRNTAFSSFAEIISTFLAGRQEHAVRACFGAA
ncbi:MAG: glucokinase, partial [Candidatus Electrothrix sp. EH2]|nr:glucokinase [Candidatus Electrothrix sp. EH2]